MLPDWNMEMEHFPLVPTSHKGCRYKMACLWKSQKIKINTLNGVQTLHLRDTPWNWECSLTDTDLSLPFTNHPTSFILWISFTFIPDYDQIALKTPCVSALSILAVVELYHGESEIKCTYCMIAWFRVMCCYKHTQLRAPQLLWRNRH